MKFDFGSKYADIKPSTKKPILPLLVVLLVVVIGVTGYLWIWSDFNATFNDALYMTIITITTVGYNEIFPLDDLGRVFTMIISIAGIGSLFFVLSIFMENLFILQLHNYRRKKKKMKEIEKLNNHIILIGYGKVGQLAASILLNQGEKFVVIDDDFEEEDDLSLKDSLLKVIGNATEDSVLIKAGIKRARGLIVATGDSATTVFIVLTAKVLNPNVFIVARADDSSDIVKLQRAGADRIVNPYSIGGQRMANLMINPNVTDFLETSININNHGLKIENLNIPSNCSWINKTLLDIDLRKKYGVSILAVIRDGEPISNPGGEFLLHKDDKLIIMGNETELRTLEKVLLKGEE